MEEIIPKVLELYLQYGIKSITMDDVARELCISKKTLYQYFKDKDDLVNHAIKHLYNKHDKEICTLKKQGNNAIDELLIVSKYISSYIKSINPSFNYDLQKYYPEIWKKILMQRRNHIHDHIKKNIKKGIEEGLFRDDTNIDIIVSYYVFRIEMSVAFDFQCNHSFSPEEVFSTLFIYHIRGIANNKGIRHLEKIIKNNKL